jgi:hypothetical protein
MRKWHLRVNGSEKIGVIAVIDPKETFDQQDEVSHDIFLEEENCLYKHIFEPIVKTFKY